MLPPSGEGGVSTGSGGGGAELAGNNGWCRILLVPDSLALVLLLTPFAVLTVMERERNSVRRRMKKLKKLK